MFSACRNFFSLRLLSARGHIDDHRARLEDRGDGELSGKRGRQHRFAVFMQVILHRRQQGKLQRLCPCVGFSPLDAIELVSNK